MAAGARARPRAKPAKRSSRPRAGPDYVLVLAVAGLIIIGLMMVYSATFDWSYQKYQSSFHIASRQFLWVGLGVALVAWLWWYALIPFALSGAAILLSGGGRVIWKETVSSDV